MIGLMSVAKVRLFVDHPIGQRQSVPLDRDQAHYLFAVMRRGPDSAVAALPLWQHHLGGWR